jgi:hypothetical protein
VFSAIARSSRTLVPFRAEVPFSFIYLFIYYYYSSVDTCAQGDVNDEVSSLNPKKFLFLPPNHLLTSDCNPD